MGNLNALFHEREAQLLARAKVLTEELKLKFGEHGGLHLDSNMGAVGGANPAADALAQFHRGHPESLVDCEVIGGNVGRIITLSNQGLL